MRCKVTDDTERMLREEQDAEVYAKTFDGVMDRSESCAGKDCVARIAENVPDELDGTFTDHYYAVLMDGQWFCKDCAKVALNDDGADDEARALLADACTAAQELSLRQVASMGKTDHLIEIKRRDYWKARNRAEKRLAGLIRMENVLKAKGSRP